MTPKQLIGLVSTEELLRVTESAEPGTRLHLMRELVVSLREQVDDWRERARAYAILFAAVGFLCGLLAGQFAK